MPTLLPMEYRSTGSDFSPWDLLPSPYPRDVRYYTRYFYENVAKHLVKDFVTIMNNGLAIDLERVEELEKELEKQLESVTERLQQNELVKEFLTLQHQKLIQEQNVKLQNKFKKPEDYLTDFDYKNNIHRSAFMDVYAEFVGMSKPTAKIEGTDISKWSYKTIKTLATSKPLLATLLNGELSFTNKFAVEAMYRIARHKADLYNKKLFDKLERKPIPFPQFNPSSAQQKQQLFAWLGIESEATSKTTNLPSWNRDQIERVNHETEDERVKDLTQCFIDHSFAAIVKNNFIEAFYRYTVDGRLYGHLTLFGAKSFRPTSSNPNMLNMPSTKSIFAKPVKKCFVAPKGRVVLTADYSALEDRVIANLSKDPNKLALFLEDLDGHSLSATYYYPDRVKELIGDFTDNKKAAVALKKLVDEGNAEAKQVRQASKPVSFGLAYGAYPKKVAQTIKVPLETAQAIFDAYHYEMYPKITDYRENYVLATAKAEGEVHLGLGCKILTDDPDRDIRTLANATVQFWSILTLLAINKFHKELEKHNLTHRVMITSTIYDAVYLEADNDPELIKWINDTFIPIMKAPYLIDETIPNLVDLEVGKDWASFHKIENNASLEEITELLANLEG